MFIEEDTHVEVSFEVLWIRLEGLIVQREDLVIQCLGVTVLTREQLHFDALSQRVQGVDVLRIQL